MLQILLTLLLVSAFLLGILWLWVEVDKRHRRAMADVEPCRLRSGCGHCTQTCAQRISTEETSL